MLIGNVIGNVWATRKDNGLNGCKLMVVRPQTYQGPARAGAIVAVDTIGAGVGETVLIASGSAARLAIGSGKSPVDHVIVGIVDTIDLPGEKEVE